MWFLLFITKPSYGNREKITRARARVQLNAGFMIQVYSFGNGGNRKVPLYVWGNANSGCTNPGNGPVIVNPSVLTTNYSSQPKVYDDGVAHFCKHLREALRWQTESQAFQYSAWSQWPSPEKVQEWWGLPVLPVPTADDDPFQDSNALIPIELNWRNNGWTSDGKPSWAVEGKRRDNVAYDNHDSGAQITHFPVIHCRKGSLGYKLQWKNPGDPNAQTLSMIYTSDTRPETNSTWQAINIGPDGKTNGVDVFIHEMILPPDALVYKNLLTNAAPPVNEDWFQAGVQQAAAVEESSHTPQGAFGYLLSQINPRPRLTVATHFRSLGSQGPAQYRRRGSPQ